MLAALLILAAVAQPAEPSVDAPPTATEVSAKLEPAGGSCVMYTNGVCICSEYQPTVDQLSCNRGAETGDYVCSYNVVWDDMTGMDPRYVEQRMDLFRKAAEGWSKSEHRTPVILNN
jgi:hypothetical protein